MPIFSMKTGLNALNFGVLRGVFMVGKMTLFYLFFNKNGYPYVNERPASTASFSGGIG